MCQHPASLQLGLMLQRNDLREWQSCPSRFILAGLVEVQCTGSNSCRILQRTQMRQSLKPASTLESMSKLQVTDARSDPQAGYRKLASMVMATS